MCDFRSRPAKKTKITGKNAPNHAAPFKWYFWYHTKVLNIIPLCDKSCEHVLNLLHSQIKLVPSLSSN